MRQPMRISVTGVAVGASICVVAGVLAARWAGWLQRLELLAYDHQLAWAAGTPASPARVAMVDVTEEDIQRLGTYPLPDAMLARAIERLEQAGARAIGVDIYRDILVPPGSAELAERLRSNPRIVFPSKFADGTSPGVAGPEGAQVGFNNMVIDDDGVARRALLMMEDGQGGVGTSFALLLALIYLDAEGIHLGPDPDDAARVRIGGTSLAPLAPTSGSYAGVDAAGYQILLDCRGEPAQLPSASLHELLEGGAVDERFRDRIAILGLAADSIRDAFHVTCEGGEVGGAALHGRIADQLIRYAGGEGRPLRLLPDASEALVIALLAAIGAAVGAVSRSAARFGAFALAGMVSLWLLGIGGLALGWWIPIVPGGIGFAASAGIVTAFVSGRERAERAQLMQLFARHVDAKIAEEVWQRRDEFLEGGRPRPERVSASVLFVDMRGYTSRAEKLDPEDLVVWLDSYLAEFASGIMAARGFVVDYFGDGIMACFGVPVLSHELEAIRDNARRAVGCAVDMKASLARLNDRWRDQDLPPIGLRVGICSGSVVAGDLGSADRLKYGVVGDVVNTAQRLESVDSSGHDFEAQPCRILVCARTRELVGGAFRVKEVGDLRVKGKSEAVAAFQVLERAGASDVGSTSAEGGAS